jgi:molybdenum cofactor biosynthesis enzyme MoaA
MASATIIRKVIRGVYYTYDREFDIISDGRVAQASSVLDRTLVRRPVDLCVECTTWCNITCGNCFSESEADCRGRHALVEEIVGHIEQQSGSYIRICITGGEPLLHPQISKLLKLPERIADCGFVLSTNGTVREDLDEVLISHRWLSAISLHGNRDAHNKYTKSRTFDTVRRRIEKLAPATTTHIYTVLHNDLTNEDVDWLIRFRKEAGAAFLRFIILRPFGRRVPLVKVNVLGHIESRCDARSAVKRERSLTKFLSVSGKIRRTS